MQRRVDVRDNQKPQRQDTAADQHDSRNNTENNPQRAVATLRGYAVRRCFIQCGSGRNGSALSKRVVIDPEFASLKSAGICLARGAQNCYVVFNKGLCRRWIGRKWLVLDRQRFDRCTALCTEFVVWMKG